MNVYIILDQSLTWTSFLQVAKFVVDKKKALDAFNREFHLTLNMRTLPVSKRPVLLVAKFIVDEKDAPDASSNDKIFVLKTSLQIDESVVESAWYFTYIFIYEWLSAVFSGTCKRETNASERPLSTLSPLFQGSQWVEYKGVRNGAKPVKKLLLFFWEGRVCLIIHPVYIYIGISYSQVIYLHSPSGFFGNDSGNSWLFLCIWKMHF